MPATLGVMRPAPAVGSHSKSLAYDPALESMLASMHRCKHFVIQKSALPCLDKALTDKKPVQGEDCFP